MSDKAKHLLFSVTLKDCKVETFRVGGHGGQNVNKVETGVRILHAPSGAKGEGREFNSQHRNKVAAFRRMGESAAFQKWAKFAASRIVAGDKKENAVRFTMNDEDLLFEGYADGEWHKIN